MSRSCPAHCSWKRLQLRRLCVWTLACTISVCWALVSSCGCSATIRAATRAVQLCLLVASGNLGSVRSLQTLVQSFLKTCPAAAHLPELPVFCPQGLSRCGTPTSMLLYSVPFTCMSWWADMLVFQKIRTNTNVVFVHTCKEEVAGIIILAVAVLGVEKLQILWACGCWRCRKELMTAGASECK